MNKEQRAALISKHQEKIDQFNIATGDYGTDLVPLLLAIIWEMEATQKSFTDTIKAATAPATPPTP